MIAHGADGEPDVFRDFSYGPGVHRVKDLQNLPLSFTDPRMIPEQDEPITFAARPGCADDFEEPPINQFIDVGSCVVGVDAELVAQVLGGDDAHLLCQDQRDLLITIDAVGGPARVIFQPLVNFGVEQPKTVNCHGKSPDLCP